MKRIFTLLISFVLLLSCLSIISFAAVEKTLLFEVSVDGKNEITVNAGDRITVDFTVQNISDSKSFTITNLQNEIEFDDEFFEFTEGDVELVTAYFSRYADDYTWGAKRVLLLARHLDGGEPKEYENKQLVARVTFKVKDGLAEGAYGKLENKVCEADDAIGRITYATSSKGMTVYIGSAPEEKYTVTYKNGDSVINTSENAKDSNIKIYSGLTMADKRFAGWKDTHGKIWQAGDSYTVTENMTFTAVWLSKYTLTFDTDGGSEVSEKVVWENEEINLSDYVTTKAGFTFDGWYEDKALTKEVSSITLSSDTTVYAKWKKNDSGAGIVITKKYTLSFDTNGGTEINSVKAKSGTRLYLDKYVTEKSGYRFDGWYSDKELTKKVTEVTLNKDMTVYAKWRTVSVKPEILTDEHYAYIVGREDGMVAPESDITRAEVATIIYRLLNEEERSKAKTKENVFTDVNEGDWFNTAVSTLAGLGLVNGRTAEAYEPNSFITRAELATIFARMVEVEYDGKVIFSDVAGHWAEIYINEASTAEWIFGYNGLFRPDDNITRAEVMTLVNRVLNRQPESKADLLDGMATWKDNADETAWYYIAVQEATNSHTYEMKADGKHEKWIDLAENPDWTKLEK